LISVWSNSFEELKTIVK